MLVLAGSNNSLEGEEEFGSNLVKQNLEDDYQIQKLSKQTNSSAKKKISLDFFRDKM